jgi:hypothetical protein
MGDWAKLQGIYLFLGSLFIGIFYWVIRRSPRRWWLIFWLVSLPILLFFFFLEPFIIDPMFFRYEPLSAKAPQLIPPLSSAADERMGGNPTRHLLVLHPIGSDDEIEGLLRTMYDPRNTLALNVSADLQKHFGEKLYRTVIPRNVRLAEAPSYGIPALYLDRTSKGAQAYLALAGEMLRRDESAAATEPQATHG